MTYIKSKSPRKKVIDQLDKIFRECLLLRDKVCQYSGKVDNLLQYNVY